MTRRFVALVGLLIALGAVGCEASHADLRRDACRWQRRVCSALDAACSSGGEAP